MSKSIVYAGVDVGKDELWVAMTKRKPRKFANTKAGVKALVNWCRKVVGDAALHVCMEATGVYSQAAAVNLYPLAKVEISIVNPAQIAAFAKAQLRRTKTDSVDARVILEFAQSQSPPVWAPAPKAFQQLYALVKQADAMRDSLARWNNRAHAQSYLCDLPREVKKSQRDVECFFTRQLEKLEKAIDELIKSDDTLKRQVKLLNTIPGIADLTAHRMLAYGKEHLTRRSAKELTAHAGLAPKHRQSGSSIRGKSRLNKAGDRRLRTILYMPTLCAIVHNPIIKKRYQHLLDQGKCKMLAVVACMRKLLLIIQAMLIKNKPFNPEILTLT